MIHIPEDIGEGEIAVTELTSSSVKLQWRAYPGVTTYTIEASPPTAVATVLVSGTMTPITILEPGRVFNLTVANLVASTVALAQVSIRSGK